MTETIKEKTTGNYPVEKNIKDRLSGEFIQGKENIEKLAEQWDNLFSRAKDAQPFSSRAWIQTFINNNRFKGKPCLLVVWHGNRMAALLPLSVYSICGIRIGKVTGTEEPSYLGIIRDPEYPEAVSVLAQTWIKEKVANVFQDKHILSTDKATLDFVSELEKLGFSNKYGYQRLCRVIKLGCSYEDYLKDQIPKGKRRYKLRYEENKLFKSGEVKIIRYLGSEITPEILKRIAVIQNESRLKQRGGAVLGRPFYQELLTNLAKADLGSVWLMTIDGDDAAFAYNMAAHGRLYYHWPAYKLKYKSALSIGQMLLMQIIRDACADGITLFDFGHSDAEYKRFWANQTQYVNWTVAGRGLAGKAVILYHRILWWLAGKRALLSFYRRWKIRLLVLKP